MGILDELAVFGDCFSRYWVYDRGTKMLNVDLIVILGAMEGLEVMHVSGIHVV